ncbi:MAG TPA: HK97-gp10 family putative phage morphogenesis protein [Methylophilaceae bacterium]
MADKWELQGFDKVIAKLKQLPVQIRGKAGRSALGSAARIVTKDAKSRALNVDDKDTGRKIADNIVQRFRTRYFRQTGDLMVSVGVGTENGRIPKGNPDTGPKGNTPHWHLIELGTERAKAQPFLQPALQGNIPAVQDMFAKKLDQQIDKIVKKGGF